ncbi:MAG TPA: hypothetical protein VH333_26295 [Pseudonocardiaceae bacterium]|jgi:hypothetical protein|nr:hypothetical protein [Pseudonocardiaceae bacterium]
MAANTPRRRLALRVTLLVVGALAFAGLVTGPADVDAANSAATAPRPRSG